MPKLVVNVGGMFSGKTTELQRQGERHILAGNKVLFIKPSTDTRYLEECITTHKGNAVKALTVEPLDLYNHIEELMNYDVILFDEVQFFQPNLYIIVDLLLNAGITVYASGLDLDFMGRGFETTEKLMSLADEVQKFKAVCESCGADACYTGRRKSASSKEIIKIGEKDIYKPLCRKCYKSEKMKGVIE